MTDKPYYMKLTLGFMRRGNSVLTTITEQEGIKRGSWSMSSSDHNISISSNSNTGWDGSTLHVRGTNTSRDDDVAVTNTQGSDHPDRSDANINLIRRLLDAASTYFDLIGTTDLDLVPANEVPSEAFARITNGDSFTFFTFIKNIDGKVMPPEVEFSRVR